MKAFNKPPKTFSEQLEILKSRGMLVSDEQKAIIFPKPIWAFPRIGKVIQSGR